LYRRCRRPVKVYQRRLLGILTTVSHPIGGNRHPVFHLHQQTLPII